MHILLTRPLEDCSDMILKFQSLGNQVSHLPLLNVNKVNYEEINFSDFKGIIFTSANAVKFLDLKEIDKKIDVVFHDADKKDKDIENFIVKYKEVLDKYCVLAFTKLQDVGIQGKIENALKSNGFTIIAEQLIPDTDMGLDGRSAVGLYYVENKIVPQKVKA